MALREVVEHGFHFFVLCGAGHLILRVPEIGRNPAFATNLAARSACAVEIMAGNREHVVSLILCPIEKSGSHVGIPGIA